LGLMGYLEEETVEAIVVGVVWSGHWMVSAVVL